jgi:L-alanine-DL-glutamate epimerase-like enolase superfamily enzyme
MKLRFHPITLELKHAFTLAVGSRLSTPAMLVEVEQDDILGYGEASMPPYLGESHATASAFLARVKLNDCDNPLDLDDIICSVDEIAPGNNAAKAAVDIALHDWAGKKLGRSWYDIWNVDPSATPFTSFTIGIDNDKESIRKKVSEAGEFKVLKVKLGGEHDEEMMQTIREATDVPLRVDVNQGWRDKSHALKMIEWLATKNVEFIEQPMPKELVDEQVWLKERSPLPIIADEAVVRVSDVRKVCGVYDGINIKLMKCTGMNEAHRMIELASTLGLKVMIGCMTETSCAISAAAQLSPMAHWADLDGALLIKNDPFRGVTIEGGKVRLPDGPGIGVTRITDEI